MINDEARYSSAPGRQLEGVKNIGKVTFFLKLVTRNANQLCSVTIDTNQFGAAIAC